MYPMRGISSNAYIKMGYIYLPIPKRVWNEENVNPAKTPNIAINNNALIQPQSYMTVNMPVVLLYSGAAY